MRRAPAVAGQFYHATRERLSGQVEEYIDRNAPKEDCLGIVSPHAGLLYSGAVAGAVYSSIKFPKTFLLLGPNHTRLGARFSLMESGEWEIPTGVFQIDTKLAGKIMQNCPAVSRDSKAHLFEHSLEVQLPFIACFSGDVRIVPLAMLTATVEECLELAEGIAKAVKAVDYPVVIVASSDMSHYLPDKVARAKDRMAIDRMLNLDAKGLYETVRREEITMCGYLPTTVMLAAAKLLGAGSARLVKYATSGDVSGDYDSVVGYAGIVVR
ncbi:MAG: AmmeMemoRadiSam system protein B [Nitrospiraceae bacterium]|nr:AmmeMemoRadiSam system protein B [Nitrospiraceae bacterium]